jgi:hypothetical protein
VCLLALCCVAPLLVGCGLHSGGDALAYIRGDQLWSIQPDGTNQLELEPSSVASFAWSPDHHQVVLRLTSVTAVPPIESTLGMPESASVIGAEGINGGGALQLSPAAAAGLVRADAWWNHDGNRLVYTERFPGAQPPTYIVSQSDQPVGIARKALLDAASIPALAHDGSQVAVIAPDGSVRVGKPGAAGVSVASGALLTLPGSNRPGRVVWQPGADALLYATTSPGGVSLVLRPLAGDTRHTVATTAELLDYAFSPDGSQVLVRTPQSFELWSAEGGTAPLYTWPEPDPLALPFWSPDGRSLLVQDGAGWQLVDPKSHTVKVLLAYGHPLAQQVPPGAAWHPAASSPWSPDGTRVVLVSVAGDTWQGSPLPQPQGSAQGLYVASVSAAHTGTPSLIDSGPDRAPGWSALDPSTAFLVAA